MSAADCYQPFLMALCLWREARGQSDDARRGVLHVILNRAKARFRGDTPAVVILWPYQFSSFNAKDPNAARIPTEANLADWRAWQACCAIVDAPGDDPTGGALMYESCYAAGPDWATPDKQTAEIGPFRFYRA